VTEAVASGNAPEGEGLTTRDLSVETVAVAAVDDGNENGSSNSMENLSKALSVVVDATDRAAAGGAEGADRSLEPV